MSEHIGGGQYRLRIQNNTPRDKKQWWTFDSRSQTIRSWSRRNYVIANQKGYQYRIGVAATARPFTNDLYSRSEWFNGSRRNIRNFGGKCLTVNGAHNKHRRHVTFWNCGNGLHQAWIIDQNAYNWPKPKYPNGVRFQIKSRMATFRALYWNEHTGGNQFKLRIRNNKPKDARQWFVWDYRSRSVRAWNKRSHAIGNTLGFYGIGRAAVIRPWRKGSDMWTFFHGGSRRNIRNV